MLRAIMLLCWLIFLSGCSSKTTPASTAMRKMSNIGAKPTIEECEQLGKQLEAAIKNKDAATINGFYRLTDLFSRLLEDLVPAGKKSQMDQNFSQAVAPSLASFVQKLQGAKVRFLRVKMVDDQPRVILRILSESDGVNYHECPIVRHADGKLAAEDIYIVCAGEMLSTTIRRLMIPILSQVNKGLFESLSESDRIYIKHVEQMANMTTLFRQGKKDQAMAVYDQLPKLLQSDKTLLMVAIQSSSIDDKRYQQFLEKYRQLFPTDRAIDLISIDYFLLQKKYDETIQCIDRIISTFGDDAYLRTMKASTYNEAKRYADAAREVDIALKLEDDMEDAYWVRVMAAAHEDKHQETADWIKKVVEKTNVELDFDAIATTAIYSRFIKTREYAALKAWYASRKK